MDKGIMLFTFIIIFLGIFLYAFERKRIFTREIPIIVTLATIAALLRIPFAAIPGFQLTTFIVILAGIVFGSLPGFIVAVTTVLISNMFLGHGPWTVFQMTAWGLCGILSGLISEHLKNKYTLAVYGFFWGFLFGWINNLWYWISFVSPLTFQSWGITNLGFAWFDLIHGLTNFILLTYIGTDFINILRRFKKKTSYIQL